MVALSHCRKCETYYPKSQGGCKWCGTKPPANTSLRYWIGGALALAAVAGTWGVIRWRGRSGEAVHAPPLAGESPVRVDSQGAAPDSTPTAPLATESLGVADSSTVAASEPAAAPPEVLVAPQPIAQPPTVSPAAVRWERATAQTYINVRSGPDRKAPVVGVVTPAMNVELGTRSRGWRLVRAPGINGWADPRNFITAQSR